MSNKPKIIFDVLTIFPEMFPSYFGGSILGKAQEAGYIKINVHNLRDFAQGLPAPRPGTYFVYYWIDAEQQVVESNEDNNSFSTSFLVE